MPVEGFDHVAITVADVDATLAWYERVLGAEPLHLDLWRAGRMPIALLQVGASRLSVHPAAAPASPHARLPTAGSADLCFRYDGPVGEILGHLDACGVDVVEGPVPRPASNGERGASVYFRDPDGNLLELLTLTPDA
jgi:catechol 2,3-dioxygenase-like lactoylglutathione lyase family enzyme